MSAHPFLLFGEKAGTGVKQKRRRHSLVMQENTCRHNDPHRDEFPGWEHNISQAWEFPSTLLRMVNLLNHIPHRASYQRGLITGKVRFAINRAPTTDLIGRSF